MSNRRKYPKIFNAISAIIAGALACGLASLLTTNPALLLGILIISIGIQVFAVSWFLYRFRFWENWPPTGIQIFFGVLISGLLIFVIFLNVVAIPGGFREVWLQNFGVVTKGEIVGRQLIRDTYRGRTSEYYRTTYQWGHSDVQYTGNTKVDVSWSEQADIGAQVTIRYLPTYPDISRVEEIFVRPPLEEVGFAFFVNYFVIFSVVFYSIWKTTKEDKLSENGGTVE